MNPNSKLSDGATLKRISFIEAILEDKTKLFHASYELRMVRWSALDKPSETCDEEDEAPDVMRCITRYVEDTAGCRSPMIGFNKTLPECNTKKQLNDVRKLSILA